MHKTSDQGETLWLQDCGCVEYVIASKNLYEKYLKKQKDFYVTYFGARKSKQQGWQRCIEKGFTKLSSAEGKLLEAVTSFYQVGIEEEGE